MGRHKKKLAQETGGNGGGWLSLGFQITLVVHLHIAKSRMGPNKVSFIRGKITWSKMMQASGEGEASRTPWPL